MLIHYKVGNVIVLGAILNQKTIADLRVEIFITF